jgi:uncharacterized protein YndB with AHSA1/START domain
MSSTRKHVHQIELPVRPEQVFALLHTPSAICDWWKASRAIVIAKPGGTWAAAWGSEDDPDYVTTATIETFDPPRKMGLVEFKYHARSGELPFPTSDLRTEFTVEPLNGGSLLKVIQDGFPMDPIADEFYQGCEVGWRATFENIREYLLPKSS